jgi:anthranilate synthase/aminodeoxychorismate synthase-like glutamine amidotransferase
MILLVDHQDSFTRNLEHLLADLDRIEVTDRRNISDRQIKEAKIIVLSPGPGKPDDYPETQSIYRSLRGIKPIIGICLGFQLMLQEEGGRIIRQKQVLHGVETEIQTRDGSLTYFGLVSPIRVARYHSLQIAPDSLSLLTSSINITAQDPIRDVPLSFEDKIRKLFGLQFHPESFLSLQGERIIQNIHHACVDKNGGTDQPS